MDHDLADEIKLKHPDVDRYAGQTVADKYEIVERIGIGGMGVVYKVHHKTLNRFFAVKIMVGGNFGFDTKALARFQQEARTVSGLHHQNLVGVHDFGTMPDGAPYLVMDYVEGKSLSALIKEKGKLDPTEALAIATQICAGLAYAHDKGVIHRDLKPSNIIVSEGNAGLSARILDFGIAKVVDINDEERKTLTQTGEIIGSPHYMSPEQCMGYKIDARSDIYSLGCLMFEMLAGKPVFDAPSPLAIMMLHMNERAPLFRSLTETTNVRPEVERIVMQTLEKEADMRYQCVEDLRNDLLLALEGKNPVKEQARARQRRRNALSLAKSLVMPALIVAATICGIGGYLIFAEASKPAWVRSWEGAQHQMVIQNLNTADANFVQAEQQADAAGARSPELLRMLVMHSQLLRTIDDNDRGAEVAKKALQLSEQLGEHSKRGEIYDAIAEASLNGGKYEQAAAAGLASLKEKQNNRLEPTYIAHSFQRLGQIYRRLRKYSDAEVADLKALEIYLSTGDKLGAADIYEQLGNLYADQDLHDKSLKNAQLSYDLNTQVRGEQHVLTKKVKLLIEKQTKLKTSNPSNR